MAHCQNCGAVLSSGVRFCAQCGQPIGQAPNPHPPPQVVYVPQATQVVNVKQVNRNGCGTGLSNGCGCIVIIIIVIIILAIIGSQHH